MKKFIGKVVEMDTELINTGTSAVTGKSYNVLNFRIEHEDIEVEDGVNMGGTEIARVVCFDGIAKLALEKLKVGTMVLLGKCRRDERTFKKADGSSGTSNDIVPNSLKIIKTEKQYASMAAVLEAQAVSTSNLALNLNC